METARQIISSPVIHTKQAAMLNLTARVWYEAAGVETLSLFNQAQTSTDLEPFLQRLFSWVANQQPLAALPHILALPSSPLRERLFVNVAYGVDVKDVDAIIKIIDDLPVDERGRVASIAGEALARKAPERALLWADTLTDAQAARILKTALRLIADTDPLRAINLAKRMSDKHSVDVIRNALAVLSSTDPLEAITQYEQLPDSWWKSRALLGLVNGWGANDPAAAANWLASVDTPPGQENLMTTLGRLWAQSEPLAAADYLSQLPEHTRLAWLKGIVRATSDKAPEDNLEWIQRFRDEKYFPQLLTYSMESLYRQNHSVALGYVMAMDEVNRNIALPGLIRRTASNDAALAATWLPEITDASYRKAATETVVDNWIKHDLTGAEQWINDLPEGDIKDTALASMMIHGGAAENVSLAANIKNRETRLAAYLGSTMPYYCAKISVSFLQQIPLNPEQWRSVETRLRLTLIYWILCYRWLNLIITPARVDQVILTLGLVGALFLVLYVTFLGSDGDTYRTLRRYGTVVFFGFTFLAQLLFAKRIIDAEISSPMVRWKYRMAIFI
ncbi:unnamed protein product [Symbiodinium necroappetens]|uniref:Uncharacterized protein n=1 Tax=Symbiodinium necroappetens TaxID=1628268 RepID=A0A813BW45_9DINO|nr:unnamed protein product [Symbiodinium necroappetens]